MSVISRLLLIQPDPWIVEGLRFGFKREGVEVDATEPGDGLERRVSSGSPELVITGGRSQEEGLSLLARVREAVAAAGSPIPILYLGNGVSREQALAEGAAEVLGQPAYVRDVVTLARLLASPTGADPASFSGELNDHFGLFYLMRAVSRAQKRGVLTLVRGLRRGELRFYDGEVTSAQVGTLHGLAALHQLLLWTEGRFELRPENIIRRQQIPLAPADCLADAERFLSEVKEVAGDLSPSEVYEPVRDSRLDEAPAEVQEILKFFDGSRTVADVVEDSPYRMFDTFRVARRLAELGGIKRTSMARDRHRARTALAIEEWLVGGIGDRAGDKEKDRRRVADVEWGQILPAQGSGDPESLSPVVPSTAAAGEIVASREVTPTSADRDYLPAGPSVQVEAPARERIEEVAGSEELNRMFPSEESDSKEQEKARLGEVDTEPTPRFSADEASLEKSDGEASSHKADAAAPSAEGDAKAPSEKPEDEASSAKSDAEAPSAEGDAKAPSEKPEDEAASAKSDVETPSAKLDAEASSAEPAGEASSAEPAGEASSAEPAGEAPSAEPAGEASSAESDGEASSAEPDAEGAKERFGEKTASGELEVPEPKVLQSPADEGGSVQVADQGAADRGEEDRTAAEDAPDEGPAEDAPDEGPAGEAPGEAAAAAGEGEAERAPASGARAESEDAAFTDDERAFFARGSELANEPADTPESFDDLDEDYEIPKTFWQRLLSNPNDGPRRSDKEKRIRIRRRRRK